MRVSSIFWVIFFGMALGLPAQTNLVYNGSFEQGVFDGWTIVFGVAGHVNESGAADGRNFLELLSGGDLWQDVPTVPGRSYIVRFAISEWKNYVRVLWGGAVIGELNLTNAPYQKWIYTNFIGAATSSVSRLEFKQVIGTSTLDDVTAGWRDEPPSIISQVPSRSTFAGGTVTFPVVANGGPPLTYQWNFNDSPINDGTNRVLTIINVQKAAEGNYLVTVTNGFGQISSLPASLVVQQIPNLPLIVFQPKQLQATAGYFAGFYVFAVGAQPLYYYWRFNETNDITGATNAHYSIPSVALSDAGNYSVMVSNSFGTTVSLPANLSVVSGYGGGVVIGDNYNPPDVDAPVFDVDGATPLAGPAYLAQVYAGATSNSLHAVGASATFLADFAGYYFFDNPVPIPDVPAGQYAFVQVRAWESRFGATFEEAKALGGKFGKSAILSLQLVGPPPSPTPLSGLASFSLQAGQPVLATAKLYLGEQLPGGDRQWQLVGDIGAQYVVERRSPPNDWSPFLTVTNLTGTVTFVDTNAQNSSVNFYRARILEQ